MNVPAENPLGDYAARLKRRCVPHYLPPEFRVVSTLESGERLRLGALLDRLSRTLAETWFIRGAAGTGKTSLINSLAAELASRNVACLRITPELLRHISAFPDAAAFVRAQAPADVIDRVWEARAKRNKVVLLVDGVNEIRREWGADERWSFVKSLIIGGHRFPVVAVSRYPIDVDFETLDARTIHDASFVPLAAESILAYLSERGVDADDALRQMRSAGLEGAGSNPFLLSLVADYLLATGQAGGPLPRSRAGLLSLTLDHAISHLPLEDRSAQETKLGMRLMATAGAILSLKHPEGFRLRALKDLVSPAGNRAAVSQELMSAFPHTHLVTQEEDRLRYVHDSLVDFGLALAFRDRPPPFFSLTSDAIDQFLGDWVGLAADPDAAAAQAVELARECLRTDALVDVVLANHGLLSGSTRRNIWMAVGEGLTAVRIARDRTADVLGRLAKSQARDALRNRVLRRVEDESPAMAEEIASLMLDGGLNALTMQKLHRHQMRGRFDEQEPNRPAPGAAPTTEDLQSATSQVRLDAVLSLCERPDVAFQTTLMDLVVHDSFGMVRGTSAKALGILGDPVAIDALASRLDPLVEPLNGVRGSAANALGRIAHPRPVPLLVASLDPSRERHPDVRGSAAHALGRIGDPSAVEALTLALDPVREPDASVRGSAANALGRFPDPRTLEALVACIDPQREPNAIVRASAANSLGRMWDPKAIDALMACLDPSLEAHPSVRASAADALGRIGDPRTTEILTGCLDPKREPDSRTRGTAANALGRIGDPRAEAALRMRCLDAGETVLTRSAALDALGRIADVDASWLISLSESVRREPRQPGDPPAGPLMGKIVELAGSLPATPETVDWFRRMARRSLDPLSRTAAVQALDRLDHLDDETIHFLIDPDFKRPDGRPHDTDNGVRGSVGAAIMRRFASGAPPAGWLDLVARMCGNPATWVSVVHSSLAPIDRMDPVSGLRAIDSLSAALPEAQPVNRDLLRAIERKRINLTRRRDGDADLQRLLDHPEEVLMAFKNPEEQSATGKTPDIVLITAMVRERAAAIAQLRDRGLAPEMHSHAGRFYHRFEMARASLPALTVWLAQPSGEGPQPMHALMADVLELSPRMIMMVGVAGGVQGRVKEGDVVMARQIHNYEPGKDTAEGFLARTQTYKCSAILSDLANALHADGALDAALEGFRLLTDKDYASGEKVLMNPDSATRTRIESQSVDLIAFETEGHGMLHPLWERERKNLPPVPAALIKTVTDLGDAAMVEGKEERQRKGASRAMQIALALVAHLPAP